MKRTEIKYGIVNKNISISSESERRFYIITRTENEIKKYLGTEYIDKQHTIPVCVIEHDENVAKELLKTFEDIENGIPSYSMED